jgi:dihydroorotate dehydrogenase
MPGFTDIARAGLLFLDPEKAHETSLKAIEAGFLPRRRGEPDSRLAQTIAGLAFPTPVGLAAGYDKDARVFNPLLKAGFGFVEVGTITPLPQPGNEKPRVFRLMRHHAVINRLGFNSQGLEAARLRLAAASFAGVVGVNIGANKEAADPIADYRTGVRAFGPLASYLTVNISSPNTPGLRDLQAPDRLKALLAALSEERAALPRHVPVFVKISPDIHDDDVVPIAQLLLAHGIDGAIVSNTTVARNNVPPNAHRGQQGGLSGRPLFARSTRLLARLYLATEGRLPLIGVGGVDSGAAAVAKVKAGASLIQLYTGLIYEGMGLIIEIEKALLEAMDQLGKPLHGLRGQDAERWANIEL